MILTFVRSIQKVAIENHAMGHEKGILILIYERNYTI